ncbi:unnamed protein product [Symbiodinium natans]|uniref:Uncharacterized protein n=1 Tax=Symbiodinium natans TaxID=878477 RepID=A0A812M022_9DINO|nr:unnamed protein product [Symbiodinium natans]
MKTANLDNFDLIHEEVAKVMEKELDKCGSLKALIQAEHDKGWEQVKLRMEQLQAAKQKIQEQKRATKEKAEVHVKELDEAVAAAEAAASVLKEAAERLTVDGAEKFKLEQARAVAQGAQGIVAYLRGLYTILCWPVFRTLQRLE